MDTLSGPLHGLGEGICCPLTLMPNTPRQVLPQRHMHFPPFCVTLSNQRGNLLAFESTSPICRLYRNDTCTSAVSSCLNCTTLPHNALYSSGGDPYNVDNCAWTCVSGKPSTPNPTPQTLRPKPQTLHPKPYTLNPKFETPNLTP